MLFDFFPSHTLTTYLAKKFTIAIVSWLGVLVLVLMALDLLGKTGDILSVEGNGNAELWLYVSLRTPQLIARFLPYSVLLATIITLMTLNQNSEVTAMKAAGLSAHQILAPLLLIGMIVAAISFVFNERIVTRATGTLKAWEAVEYAAIPEDRATRTNVYFNDGNDVLMGATLSGRGEGTVLGKVSYYERDDAGMIIRQATADRATFAGPGWRLEDATVFNVATADTQQVDTLVVAEGVEIAQIELRRVDPDGMPLGELSDSIEALQDAGRRTDELEAKWWHKISGPLSAVLMPLLGAVAGFGLARSGQLFTRAVIGMALGFAYFVVDNAALAMGSFGGYPPLLAAWAPFFLFLFVGETVLVRTEE
ncbi:LPS export ABC transporter permease LptG [Aurantiacibacter poecillastricola]|uniref:LPS export ABC transporter permease LptG n=1 Tax=Aurantiacibacter poecillastricola TaxID=3064385 RepID=UPI00273FFCD6|nr:LPS export ABC transporter permease LptG [Aurantiacibacter sp. 219JJ12-13]MDP5261177.1 LPS export ABC transporter permease LptG [Aurantiacibacter sp. 219JJ12-13]